MLTTKKSTQNSGRLLRESKDGWKFRSCETNPSFLSKRIEATHRTLKFNDATARHAHHDVLHAVSNTDASEGGIKHNTRIRACVGIDPNSPMTVDETIVHPFSVGLEMRKHIIATGKRHAGNRHNTDADKLIADLASLKTRLNTEHFSFVVKVMKLIPVCDRTFFNIDTVEKTQMMFDRLNTLYKQFRHQKMPHSLR